MRVQKVRCDEIELFEEPVRQAAQLTTRSLEGAYPIVGAVEVFSTMHKPGGLMQKILLPGLKIWLGVGRGGRGGGCLRGVFGM